MDETVESDFDDLGSPVYFIIMLLYCAGYACVVLIYIIPVCAFGMDPFIDADDLCCPATDNN